MRRAPALTFFDSFRRAVTDAPAGLIRLGPPAGAGALAAAEAGLGRALPRAYADFLRSFDGADLFHESVVVFGVGPAALRDLVRAQRAAASSGVALAPGDLAFAETAAGDRLVLAARGPGADGERVVRLSGSGDDTGGDTDGGPGDRWIAGSTFALWLDATVTRLRCLYDRDGEFIHEAFLPDGEELTPVFALRQAERALKKDPGSAESHHDRGVALRRLGRLEPAALAFAAAADIDAGNPWPWFDLGRAQLALDEGERAADSFARAARAQPGRDGARLFAWAVRAAMAAGNAVEAARARQAAIERHAGIESALRRSFEAARDQGDDDAAAEARALLDAFAASQPVRHRLTVARDVPRRR